MSANEAVSPVALMYNPDRWKKVSIGRRTVGPMGIMPIYAEQATAIEQFCRNGQLVKIAGLETGQVIQYGVVLLERFREQGCRGAIVVSRTYAHGDIFLTVPVLDVLKKEFPDSELIFHTTERMEPLVRHHPGVTIITGAVALKAALRTAGVYLDLDDIPERFEEHNPGAGMNRIEIFCNYLGMTPESLRPSYYTSKDEVDSVANYLDRFKRPFVAVSPSSMRKEKSWRPERWKELAVTVAEKAQGTVFVFDVVDILGYRRPDIVPVINKSLRTAGAMAWHMDLMITQDSLWSHWSAALGVSQILLASCTDGNLLSKGYPDVSVIQRREWDCSPCWYGMQKDDCVYGNYPKCLDDVSVGEVAAKVMEALSHG